MKVKELIKELSILPQEAEVYATDLITLQHGVYAFPVREAVDASETGKNMVMVTFISQTPPN